MLLKKVIIQLNQLKRYATPTQQDSDNTEENTDAE